MNRGGWVTAAARGMSTPGCGRREAPERQSAADHVKFAALDRPRAPAPRVMAEAARRNAKGKQRAPVDDVRLATRSLAASVG